VVSGYRSVLVTEVKEIVSPFIVDYSCLLRRQHFSFCNFATIAAIT
jgi:hypothetical protein